MKKPGRVRLSGLWWWVDRWRASTAFMDMTLEEQGAYRNLLDEANLRGGPLPKDERILAKACGDAIAWKRVRPAVMAHFYEAKDGWRNETLDGVIKESQRRVEKQQRYRDRDAAKGPPPGNTGGNESGNEGGNADGNESGNAVGLEAGNADWSLDLDLDLSLNQDPRAPSTRARVEGEIPKNLAFSGARLQVPRFLHEEFGRRLNGQAFDLHGFYAALDQRLVQTGEPWDNRWIKERFSLETPQPARVQPERQPTSKEIEQFDGWRRAVGGCGHRPKCESRQACIAHYVAHRRGVPMERAG